MDRRQALVQAGFEVIAEKGLEGLRLRDVAARAGIDHSTLHHHFATKQDLVAEIVAYATRQFWPTMPAAGTAAERLRRHLASLAGMIRERPELFAVLAEFDGRARRDDAMRRTIESHESGWRVVLADLLRTGARDGDLAGLAAEPACVELVIAAVKGVRTDPERAEDVLRQLERLLIKS